MSPLTEPLLSRFGRGEFRHFFPIQLQDAGVFMPHDLQETCQWLSIPEDVSLPAAYILTGHKEWQETLRLLTCLRRKDTTSVDSQYEAWKRCGKATVGKAVRASGQYRAKSNRFVPHQRAATVTEMEWIGCRDVRWNCKWKGWSKKIISVLNHNHHRSK